MAAAAGFAAEGTLLGEGAARRVRLSVRHAASGASCEAEVGLFGAHVLSWADGGREPLLYLSRTARLDGSAAVRGGIPLIFPQFSGFGPLPKHGFARNSLWELGGVEVVGHEAAVAAVLTLRSSDATRAVWPHEFVCTYRVVLSMVDPAAPSTLRCEWTVENPAGAKDSLAFAAALHTYFAVGDIGAVRVEAAPSGEATLQGLAYVDQLKDGARVVQDTPGVAFAEEVDRIYTGVPPALDVVDGALGRRIHIVASPELPDAVVWNPWVAKAASIGDMEDQDYKRMVCVEGANLGHDGKKQTLEPGQSWTATVTMRSSTSA